MGYKFQFITLAGFHALNYGMFNLAHGYARRQMPAFVELQEAEFAAAERGFTAVKHQREVGTGYFDAVDDKGYKAASRPSPPHGSIEDEQFFDKRETGRRWRGRATRQKRQRHNRCRFAVYGCCC
jgi:isocitrate lyase